MNLTTEDKDRLAAFLAERWLGMGCGTIECPCSVSAANWVLRGSFTDNLPPDTSQLTILLVVRLQDLMPGELRNSPRWKALIPEAMATRDDPEHDRRRQVVLGDWLWSTVLPLLQPAADRVGLGDAWRQLLASPTVAAARAMQQEAETRRRKAFATEAFTNPGWTVFRLGSAADGAGRALHPLSTFYSSVGGVAMVLDAFREVDVALPWDVIDPCALLEKVIQTP